MGDVCTFTALMTVIVSGAGLLMDIDSNCDIHYRPAIRNGLGLAFGAWTLNSSWPWMTTALNFPVKSSSWRCWTTVFEGCLHCIWPPSIVVELLSDPAVIFSGKYVKPTEQVMHLVWDVMRLFKLLDDINKLAVSRGLDVKFDADDWLIMLGCEHLKHGEET